jgi:DNA-binding NtrC family response regulator
MQSGPELLAEHLPPEICADDKNSSRTLDADRVLESGLEDAVANFEKGIILSALDKCGNNVLQAAHLLKIPRGTLRYKMEKLGLG